MYVLVGVCCARGLTLVYRPEETVARLPHQHPLQLLAPAPEQERASRTASVSITAGAHVAPDGFRRVSHDHAAQRSRQRKSADAARRQPRHAASARASERESRWRNARCSSSSGSNGQRRNGAAGASSASAGRTGLLCASTSTIAEFARIAPRAKACYAQRCRRAA